MIVFLFLFFFVFFAIIFFGIQSVTRLGLNEDGKDGEISIAVTASDVAEIGDMSNVSTIISAMEMKANNSFFALRLDGRVSRLVNTVDELTKLVAEIKMEMMVFKLMIGGLALMMGLITAFLALTGNVVTLR